MVCSLNYVWQIHFNGENWVIPQRAGFKSWSIPNMIFSPCIHQKSKVLFPISPSISAALFCFRKNLFINLLPIFYSFGWMRSMNGSGLSLHYLMGHPNLETYPELKETIQRRMRRPAVQFGYQWITERLLYIIYIEMAIHWYPICKRMAGSKPVIATV